MAYMHWHKLADVLADTARSPSGLPCGNGTLLQCTAGMLLMEHLGTVDSAGSEELADSEDSAVRWWSRTSMGCFDLAEELYDCDHCVLTIDSLSSAVRSIENSI